MGAGVLWSVSGKSTVKSPEKAPQRHAAADRVTMALAPNQSSSPMVLPTILKTRLSNRHLLTAGKLPLAFEPNQGQTDARAAYVSHGSGYGLFLTPNEAILSLGAGPKGSAPMSAVRMQFEGASGDAKVAATDSLPGKTNYFRGNDSSRWVRNVPTFSRVNYSGVYPGVDLVFYGKQGHLEYDFTVR